MPISVTCQECGKGLKAPDALAGKKAKCPQCGAVVPIPRPVVDAEVIDDELPPLRKPKDEYDDTFDDMADYEAEAPALPKEKRKPCPMCGEMILASAAKCRFCGEILDPALRKREQNRSGSSSSDDVLTTSDIVLCVLCSNIGCILGIFALIRGQSSRGGKMLGLSLLMQVVWGIVVAIVQQLGKQ